MEAKHIFPTKELLREQKDWIKYPAVFCVWYKVILKTFKKAEAAEQFLSGMDPVLSEKLGKCRNVYCSTGET